MNHSDMLLASLDALLEDLVALESKLGSSPTVIKQAAASYAIALDLKYRSSVLLTGAEIPLEPPAEASPFFQRWVRFAIERLRASRQAEGLE